eukprot:1138424-Pelagomonas_calceolata.AAC.1
MPVISLIWRTNAKNKSVRVLLVNLRHSETNGSPMTQAWFMKSLRRDALLSCRTKQVLGQCALHLVLKEKSTGRFEGDAP